jgi:hypothetical protein
MRGDVRQVFGNPVGSVSEAIVSKIRVEADDDGIRFNIDNAVAGLAEFVVKTRCAEDEQPLNT